MAIIHEREDLDIYVQHYLDDACSVWTVIRCLESLHDRTVSIADVNDIIDTLDEAKLEYNQTPHDQLPDTWLPDLAQIIYFLAE